MTGPFCGADVKSEATLPLPLWSIGIFDQILIVVTEPPICGALMARGTISSTLHFRRIKCFSLYLFMMDMYPKRHFYYPKWRVIHRNVTHNSWISCRWVSRVAIEIGLDRLKRFRRKRGILAKMLVQRPQNALPRALRQILGRVRDMARPTFLDIGRFNLWQSRISRSYQGQTGP